MNASLDPVFIACWSTGSDPVNDGVFYSEAASFTQSAGREELIAPTWTRPWAQVPAGAPLSRRLSELGLSGAKTKDLPLSADALPRIFTKLAGRPLILARGREEFLARFNYLLPEAQSPVIIDLESLALFLHPRRGVRSVEAIWKHFMGTKPPREFGISETRSLCRALIAAHLKRENGLRRMFARGFENLTDCCGNQDAEAADWLELCERLLDRPSCFSAHSDNDSSLLEEALEDGQFSDDLESSTLDADRELSGIVPMFLDEYQRHFAEHHALDKEATACGTEADSADVPEGQIGSALSPEAVKSLESFFDRLPRHFAGDGPVRAERLGQRALAHAVRQTFEEDKFLVADAPTGTGKTLGYLAPLMLWAKSNNVLTAVSTYTRALQEQAFFREIPRALALMREAGVADQDLPRVSMLKGRNNYICGRAIHDAAPDSGTGSPVSHATWLRLALYYCEDASADLDGFPAAPGPPFGASAKVIRQARAAINNVRSVPTCCTGGKAKRCAAGIRTQRAERSHLVITNHAFILAKPDFFKHIVFDECDHLHQVATSALSYDIEFDEVVSMCDSLLRGRGRDRSPLERLSRLMQQLADGDKSDELLTAVKAAHEGTAAMEARALECTRELRKYQEWRREVSGGMSREETAFLLHDFLDSGRGDQLATALNKFKEAVDTTDSGLRTCIEGLGTVYNRQAGRLRWSLRKPLDLMAHWREGLTLWLGGKNEDPAEGEKGDFSDDFLYDAEFEGRRRRPLLCLKWLLPQVWLGNVFFPTLRSAALVSATARLRGGFKAMKGYLGLDLLQETTIEKTGRELNEFVGPPTFAAEAALVCVPEDAPEYGYSGNRQTDWLDYVQDVLLFLGERANGRTLGLFTNRVVLQQVGERLAAPFAAVGIPLYWQGMPGLSKEEIAERFRARPDSVLLGLDTFWYGVDFPGETCEYVVMTKLPFGVLDDYHFAQTARLGFGRQRNRIYLPKALSMFRQGCGRLLRSESDRGGVIILDRRVLDKRHAAFLEELPGGIEDFEETNILAAKTDECFYKLFNHMQLTSEIKRRGLSVDFSSSRSSMRSG